MKKGQKIKYDAGYTDNGKDVVKVGYLVSIDGDWAWVTETKEDCKDELGHSVPVSNIIVRCAR